MRPKTIIFILISFLISILSACSSPSDPATTVSQYINALAAKDANRLAVLSCADWAQNSQQLLDSITSVDVKLSGLSCKTLSNDGKNATVNCSGKLTASYNNENQELDLSVLQYVLVKQNDDWLVCGQK